MKILSNSAVTKDHLDDLSVGIKKQIAIIWVALAAVAAIQLGTLIILCR